MSDGTGKVIQFPGAAPGFYYDRMTWDAIVCLKGQVGDQLGGTAAVSADAVHVVLICLEHLAGRLDIIPPQTPEAP